MAKRLALPGLARPVELVRDAHHIPHVLAQSFRDGIVALGYAMASDRLWQMDLMRRVARGRAAEVLGRVLLPLDALVRTLDLEGSARAAVERLDGDARDILDAFAAGVNARAGQRPLPVEFDLLGYEPGPWSPEDTVAIEYFAAWGLAQESLEPKLVLARALGGCGPERGAWLYPDGVPAELLDAERLAAYCRLDLRLLRVADALSPGGGGSNNWAVSGSCSASGQPLLASDPHLLYSAPSLWYLAHISSPEVNLLGAFYCGGPAAQVGRNRHGAWGVTNLTADDLDPVLERLDPREGSCYDAGGRWEPLRTREVGIQVRGEEEVRIAVRSTRNGPLVGPALGQAEAAPPDVLPLALRWAPLHGGGSAAAGWVAINRSRGLDDVAAAARRFGSGPVQMNLLYADVSGRIAHFAVGRVPQRGSHPGVLPPLGWRGEGTWQGFANLGVAPWVVDPPSGVVCSANERNAPAGRAPQPFGEYPARARRIRVALEGARHLTVADLARLQVDVVDLLAREHLATLSPILSGLEGLSPPAARARDLLLAWDGEVRRTSPAATVYHLLLYTHLPPTLFPAGVYGLLAARWRAGTWAVRRILAAPSSPWFPTLAAKTETLRSCLEDAAAWLVHQGGEDPAGWAWGRFHRLTLSHPLAFLDPLARARVGPLPLGGGPFAVNQQRFLSPRPPFDPILGAGVRMVVDLAEESCAYLALSTGQSGDPTSPHFADQTASWHAGEPIRVTMDPAALAPELARVRLEPRGVES